MNVALVSEVEAVIDEAIETIDSLDTVAWERQCAAEGWPVSVTALHVALGLRRQASFIALARDHRPPLVFDWEATHALNARVAARGSPKKEVVQRELRKGGSRLRALLAEMTEVGLQRVALIYQGHAFDVERIVRRIVVPHARGHLASIRSAISAAE